MSTTNPKLFYYLRALTTAVLSTTFGAVVSPLVNEGGLGFTALILSLVFATYSCYCLLVAGRQDAE